MNANIRHLEVGVQKNFVRHGKTESKDNFHGGGGGGSNCDSTTKDVVWCTGQG